MNENLDLVKILKDCPKGTKLYSIVQGEVVFDWVREADVNHPIYIRYNNGTEKYTRDGRFDKRYDGECVLFPSKDQRDWSKFKAPVKKFDYGTLKPFDKVLTRDGDNNFWRCNLFSHYHDCEYIRKFVCVHGIYKYCIPYNDDTKHLVDTMEEAPEYYRYWEE